MNMWVARLTVVMIKKGPYLKIPQPVLLESYQDEFKLPEGRVSNTPAEPRSVLVKMQAGNELDMKE
jgi:hypothetical protein